MICPPSRYGFVIFPHKLYHLKATATNTILLIKYVLWAGLDLNQIFLQKDRPRMQWVSEYNKPIAVIYV